MKPAPRPRQNNRGEDYVDALASHPYAVYDMKTSQAVSIFQWDGDPGNAPPDPGPGRSFVRLPDDTHVTVGWYWTGSEWTPEGGMVTPPATFVQLLPKAEPKGDDPGPIGPQDLP